MVRAFGSQVASAHSATSDLEELLAALGAVEDAAHEAEPISEVARLHAENAKSVGICLQFMDARESSLRSILLMRATLQPELDLMHAIVARTADKWDEHEYYKQMVSGNRDYRVCLMAESSDLQQFLKKTWAGLQDPFFWEFFPETECLRSELCKLSLRSAAVCYELIVLRTRRFPYKLFELVAASSDARDS
eukprot:2598611-Amphidinium_carterae.1